jgi:hypothetical protein
MLARNEGKEPTFFQNTGHRIGDSFSRRKTTILQKFIVLLSAVERQISCLVGIDKLNE